jgi:hypothetical protein
MQKQQVDLVVVPVDVVVHLTTCTTTSRTGRGFESDEVFAERSIEPDNQGLTDRGVRILFGSGTVQEN